MIRIDIPAAPADERDDFHKVQDEIDRSQWIGRGPNYELPGGGNELKTTGDKD